MDSAIIVKKGNEHRKTIGGKSKMRNGESFYM